MFQWSSPSTVIPVVFRAQEEGTEGGAFKRMGRFHWPQLELLDVLRLGTFGIMDDLKLDRLAFGERFESIPLDGRKMDEDVRPAFLLDKSVPFPFIEPFHRTACHVLLTSPTRLPPDECCFTEQKRPCLAPSRATTVATHPT